MAPADKILYGFIAGEVSPDFYGRTDIGKYDFGMADCTNFFVDYCGGVKSRGGLEFIAPSQGTATGIHFKHFRATFDDYILEFTAGKLRILRSGAYIREAAKTIVGVTDGNEVEVTAHGYVAGNLLYFSGPAVLAGRYLEVYDVATNTFRVREIGMGAESVEQPDTLGGGATVSRVYTISVPYTASEVSELCVEQRYEQCVITHKNHQPRKLKYISDTNWTITSLSFGASVSRPSSVALVPSASGSAGVAFCITAVRDGEESLASRYAFNTACVDYSTTAGSIRVNWSPVPGAEYYNVYRTLILPIGAEISYAQSVGFVGRAYGPQFIDNNVTPDFTKAPPQNFDPFSPNAIVNVVLDDPGKNYSNTSAVTVADADGSGFLGYPIVSPVGQTLGSLSLAGAFDGIDSPPATSSTDTRGILGITVLNGGKEYTAPTLSVGGGTGADFTLELGPSTGTYPALCKLFQQRMLYAATINEPMRVWGTKAGTLNNMDLSQVVNAEDGYSYQLDARTIKPIQHMLDLRHGLLLFTAANVTLLRAEEGKALSGVNAVAEPQAYKGANSAEPVVIDLDVIFAQRNSSSVNAMLYTEYTNSFTMQDVAVLSKHLLSGDKEIVRFAWQGEPDKLLWALRNDGVLLSLTYSREQEVFAWAKHVTQGKVVDLISLEEGGKEVLYLAIERFLRGRWIVCIERLQQRTVARAENYFAVDCGLRRQLSAGNGRLDVEVVSASVYELTFAAGVPAGMIEGSVIFFGDGRFEVTELLSGSSVSVDVIRAPKNLMHVTDKVYYVDAAEWEHCNKTDRFSGLWHLEGSMVSINADGDALGDYVVEDGELVIPQEVAYISAGLKFVASMQTLPPVVSQTVIEGKVKDIISAKVRLNKTRGLQVGTAVDSYFEMKDRLEEDWGEELALRSDFPEIVLAAPWDELTSVYIKQEYPLPAHVLSVILNLDVGD